MGMLPRLAPVVLLFSAFVSAGELKLVSLFSDHAVLQAGDAAVFGKAYPGSKVQVKLGTAEAAATAGSDGKWSATLSGLKPTEQGKDLIVSSGEETFTAHDVIVGEVWIGSGQSNMEWVVKNTTTAEEAKSRPADAGLRVFTVARTPKAEPADDVQGAWKLSAPDTVEGFTAAGFYFARELRANIKQPVGVIHTSIGGTRAEAWGPKGMYADVPEAKDFDAKEAAAIKARAAGLEKLAAKIAVEKDKAILAKLKQDVGKLAPVWSNGPHMNWNGMVAPFVGYSFRGALWYQGESNAGQPEAYKWVLGSMIKSWQKAWGKEFPFIIVQLPRFKARHPELAVEDADWPKIRESMEWIADNVPGAMQTVNIDLGEEKDIHPKNKLPIGERLAAVTEPMKLQWPSRGPKRSPDEAAEPATLILRVEGAFAIEVQHLAPLLCERINGRLGWRCVGKIALRQGPIERRATGRARAAQPPAEAVAAASKLSEGIADEGLREALTRLGARVLTKPKVK